MSRNLFGIALATALAASSALACESGSSDIEAKHPRYAPGQVWSYNTRPHEEASHLAILRIDRTEAVGFIVHVSVDGAAIKSPAAPGGISRTIAHLPFSESALDASVTSLTGEAAVPDFRAGYETWRSAFDHGKASVWKIPVAEAISAMEATLNGKSRL